MDSKTIETLEKQLELLAKRSQRELLTPHELSQLTYEMCDISRVLLRHAAQTHRKGGIFRRLRPEVKP